MSVSSMTTVIFGRLPSGSLSEESGAISWQSYLAFFSFFDLLVLHLVALVVLGACASHVGSIDVKHGVRKEVW